MNGEPDPQIDTHIDALPAAKDHLNVFVYDGGITPDPDGITAGVHPFGGGRRSNPRN